MKNHVIPVNPVIDVILFSFHALLDEFLFQKS